MPRQQKVLYKQRTFLNDDKSMSGYIIAYLEEAIYHKNEKTDRISCYPSLDIADCSNKISLDFSFYSPADLKKSLKKLRLFKSIIDGFAEAFEQEAERIDVMLKEKSVPEKKKSAKAK